MTWSRDGNYDWIPGDTRQLIVPPAPAGTVFLLDTGFDEPDHFWRGRIWRSRSINLGGTERNAALDVFDIWTPGVQFDAAFGGGGQIWIYMAPNAFCTPRTFELWRNEP